jgi:cytochrome c oxidase assembly protein subunit 15
MRTPSVPSWLPFRRFALFTSGLTLLLVMLGIYTASGGFGGGCGAFWLTCNGNLFPQTYPAFIEWFHRLVAMITGWFILGTAVWAVLGKQDRYTAGAAVLATVLLPIQVALGAVTLQVYSQGGGLPFVSAAQFASIIFAAHYVTAVSIFSLLTAATVFAYRGHHTADALTRARWAFLASLLLLPLNALLSRITTLVPYSEVVQPVFYGLSLGILGALVAGYLWLGETDHGRLRPAAGAALAVLFGHLLLGAGVLTYTMPVRLANAAGLFALFALVVGLTWALYRDDAGVDAPAPSRSD